MAEHLTGADPDKKVEWKCKDVWKGNADDLNLKKFRKNQHQQEQAVEKKGYLYPTDHQKADQ